MIFSQHESDIREKGAPLHVYAASTKAARTHVLMRERENTISTGVIV